MTNVELVSDGCVNVKQAAEFIGVGQTLLYAEMLAGRLQFIKIGRRRVIPRRALNEWAAGSVQGGWARNNSLCGNSQAV